MSNLTVENVYTRQAAKELTHKHFWKLLGMMLTVMVITYAVSFACMALAGILTESTGSGALAFVLNVAAMLVTMLVVSGLGLGLYSTMLYIARNGEQPTVGQVFSRMGQCLKAFGLMLWVGLKTLLWMLPGYALMIFSFGALMFSSTSTTDLYTGTQSIPLDPESLSIGLVLLPFLCLILIFALVIPATFRYMLSTYILADKPETSVFDCVRQSKALMKGHKWQAFKLVVPLFLLMLLAMFFVTFASSLVIALLDGGTLAIIASIVLMIAVIALDLYFSIRMNLGYCIFYTKRCAEKQTAEAQ